MSLNIQLKEKDSTIDYQGFIIPLSNLGILNDDLVEELTKSNKYKSEILTYFLLTFLDIYIKQNSKIPFGFNLKKQISAGKKEGLINLTYTIESVTEILPYKKTIKSLTIPPNLETNLFLKRDLKINELLPGFYLNFETPYIILESSLVINSLLNNNLNVFNIYGLEVFNSPEEIIDEFENYDPMEQIRISAENKLLINNSSVSTTENNNLNNNIFNNIQDNRLFVFNFIQMLIDNTITQATDLKSIIVSFSDTIVRNYNYSQEYISLIQNINKYFNKKSIDLKHFYPVVLSKNITFEIKLDEFTNKYCLNF